MAGNLALAGNHCDLFTIRGSVNVTRGSEINKIFYYFIESKKKKTKIRSMTLSSA